MAKQLNLPEPKVPGPVTVAAELAYQATDMEITDEPSMIRGTEVLALLNQALKSAEDARKALVKPLQDHVAFINSTFKERTDEVRTGITAIKQQIASYHAEAEKAEQEAVRQAAKLVGASEETQEIAAAVERPRTTHTQSGGAQIKKRWDYEVTDMKTLAAYAASGVPVSGTIVPSTDLVDPNRGALRRAVNAGARSIPGVRIFEVTDVSVV